MRKKIIEIGYTSRITLSNTLFNKWIVSNPKEKNYTK